MTYRLRRICVYCGSSPGARPEYAAAGQALGAALAAREIGLVYGGAQVGIMGQVADAVLEGGGEAIGVIPEWFMDKGVAHDGLADLRVVDSMHDRKAMMADLADGFIALPGGIGTLEEFFEALTWAQLGFHHKPCGLLNVAGYYDQVLAFLDHVVTERLMRAEHRALVLVARHPDGLLDQFKAYTPRQVDKWLDRQPEER
jgi:hypothetical protein